MEKLEIGKDIPSSFRDPSGFLFYLDGIIYRQVNIIYKENYNLLMNSGLYKTLVNAELLIAHKEVNIETKEPDKAYKIIEPEKIPFISYPYSWCFSQLKDAALATLKVQKKALEFGMSLKDSSAYNIQFRKSKPVFIDTLSFEKYREGKPWVAYRQFCQHFLAPLALMSYKDIRLNQLFRVFIDGVPLDLSSSLLPLRTRFVFSLFTHIHLHAKSQRYFANKTVNLTGHKIGRLSFLGLIDNLESAIKKLGWQAQGTEWADYYEDTNYSSDALQHKKQIVAEFFDKANPRIVWDLGANVGMFSRIASDKKIQTVSFDIDPAAVEKNYLQCIADGETNILPLVIDLTNPSPSIGWENNERMSLVERGPADMVFALALIHHLAISNNVPLNKIASFFHRICKSLIIEFVPKNDSQIKRLLSRREDIFPNYTQQVFESEFSKYFKIYNSAKIRDSERILYLMVGR
jgi:ribosomal protein L11 methylase PrmA